MTGIAGIDFVDDLIKSFRSNWVTNTGGIIPTFVKQWEVKEVGHGSNSYDVIIIGIDGENIDAFSLQHTDGLGNPAWDWLHDVSVTIDIRSGKSEKRVLQLVDEISRILKTKVLLNINNRVYVQVLPTSFTSMNEEYRNLYRYIGSADALILNP